MPCNDINSPVSETKARASLNTLQTLKGKEENIPNDFMPQNLIKRKSLKESGAGGGSDETDTFLIKHRLPKLVQEKTGNINSLVSI